MTREFESPLMRLRTLRRITQEELAREMGVSTQTVSNWETGQTTPKLTLGDWRKLAKILEVPLEQLPDRFGPQPIHDTGAGETRLGI